MSNPTTTTGPIALLPVHPSQLTLLPGWRAVHGIRSSDTEKIPWRRSAWRSLGSPFDVR
jgi:hypothetical protein